MNGNEACRGLAFIMEGATEKVFYLEYLSQLCASRGFVLKKNLDTQEDRYTVMSVSGDIVVMMASVNSVTQMTNSATWFDRACVKENPGIAWTVFLCYDTDEYNSDITKFHEGDWAMLRKSIAPSARKVVDMAAGADIEDVILCDLPGVLAFLKLPPETQVPPGNKGKTKLKKLYRKASPNKAYHSGERAKNLISHLDMAEIKASAPVPLEEIDKAIESD
ncbi:hypothetical protein [Paratractidigestivibacter sp.]|uniref:hypothetical protein n=1 Tax=Paratractidigestivibacter sp. TaxID=2847316 RepID=UPI002AC98E9C|nr:hypothetical protein [Paratractidigestivibacter sp.]